ncbi:MAG TPA: hypothetical protein VGC66_25360 [Pyrinomonadaceae bacterium]
MMNIVIALLLSPVGNQAGKCNNFVFNKLLEGPPRSQYRGRYVNGSYQYSVVIPRGFIAYDVPDPANHHGFGLAFGKPSQSYIFVNGEYNSLEYNTPVEAAMRAVEYLRQDGAQVEPETITKSNLGTLDAAHLVVIYSCPGSSKQYVLSSIIALSADKGFLYQLEIYSPANQYERDKSVLDQIIKSWKMRSTSPRRRRR